MVGNDDKRISLGDKETGARAALPIWLEFMQQAMAGMPVEEFPNVVPLERATDRQLLQVDTPDLAPPADAAEQGLAEAGAQEPGRSKPAGKPLPPRPAPARTRAPNPAETGRAPAHAAVS